MATTAIARRVERHASLARDVVRAGRSQVARKGVQNPYTAQLAKDLLSRGIAAPLKSFDHIAALVSDLAQRGNLADAESVGLIFVAIARFEHRKHHPTPTGLTVKEAHRREEEAEGAVENAEWALGHEPTIGNYLKYLQLSAAHIHARQQLDDVVAGAVVAENAEPAQ